MEAVFMETLEAIHTRKSVRKFLDKKIPDDVIRKILEAAIRAPSAGNRQPWRFLVVTDRDKIKKFDPYDHQPWVENAPAVIVACANPHDTWEKYDEEDDCYILDTSAAIQNILLAIHDMDLGGVWVLTCSKRDVRKLLDIPLHWQIISIIPFGYYDETEPINATRRSRKPLSKVTFLNSVDNPIESNSRAFTGDSTLEEILADEETRAILVKHLPDILSHPEIEKAKSYVSLNELASLPEVPVTFEMVKAIVEELSKIQLNFRNAGRTVANM
jgi:nitroreductase